MIKIIQNTAIFLSIVLITYLGYQAFFNNSAIEWDSYVKPQLAAYTSLEQDEEILEELVLYTRYSSHKPLNNSKYNTKPTIFQSINDTR